MDSNHPMVFVGNGRGIGGIGGGKDGKYNDEKCKYCLYVVFHGQYNDDIWYFGSGFW